MSDLDVPPPRDEPPAGGGYPSGRSTDHMYDHHAERALLASCLSNPEVFVDIAGTVEEESFSHPGHRALFGALIRLDSAGKPFDLITVVDELRRAEQDTLVRGREGLQALMGLAEPAHVESHATIVSEKAMMRGLAAAGQQIWSEALQPDAVADEALEAAEKTLFKVAQTGSTTSAVPMTKAVADTIASMAAARAQGGRTIGLSTGLSELDEITGGMLPGQLLVLAARPAMGKCLPSSAVVSDPRTGQRRPIGDLVSGGTDGFSVQSYDFATVTGVASPIANVFDNGVRDVVTVTTRSGRTFTATPNHRVRTLSGWVEVQDLTLGVDGIAVPSRLPEPTDPAGLDAAEVRHLAGTLPAGPDTRVPDVAFALPNDPLATFIATLWAADGWVDDRDAAAPTAGFTTVSERLARDVAHLLLRFGIVAEIARPCGDPAGRWTVTVRGSDQLDTFAAVIDGQWAAGRQTDRTAAAGDVFDFPAAIWDLIEAAKPTDMTWPALLRAAGLPVGTATDRWRRPARAHVAAIAGVLADPHLAALAVGDIVWDVVIDVTPAGTDRTYDIEVLPHHNFVCDDVVVHNSSLAVNIAQAAAERSGDTVYVASYEMSTEEITTRMIASTSGIELGDLKRGIFPAGADRKLARATEQISQLPVILDDDPPATPSMLRSEMRRLARRGKLGLIVVDYLQLMTGQSRRSNDSRATEVEEMTRQLKLLGKELKVPVLCLSQLSRKCEERHDKRPMLSDLRDSGGIEQNADNVYFLYRPWVYDNRADPESGELIVAKQRNGPTGTIRVRFHGPTTTYSDVPKAPPVDFGGDHQGPPPIGGPLNLP